MINIKVYNVAVILMLIFSFTSCEKNDINEESEIEIQVFGTDKGDSINPSGSGNDVGDNDEG